MADLTTEKRKRKPKARNVQVILGALDENARMLTRDPHTDGIGARIGELLDELGRALSGREEPEES